MNAMALLNPRLSTSIFDEFDDSLSNFFPALASNALKLSSSPVVDVVESKDKYTLEMELPGFSKENVDISLKDRVLSISSKNTEKEETKDRRYLVKERTKMNFSRSFTLPDDIDQENVSADFINGILMISIPRKEETKPRTIEIR